MKKLSSRLRSAQLESTSRWIAIVADLAVVTSIAIGLLTYFDQKAEGQEQRRREASMTLASLRHQSPYADIKVQLTSALLKEGRWGLIKKGGQRSYIEADGLKIIKEVGAGRIDNLAMLYSAIINCRADPENEDKTKLCDAKLIDELARDDIEFFYCSTRYGILPVIELDSFSDNRYKSIFSYAEEQKFTC